MKKNIRVKLSLILLFQLVAVSLLYGQGFLINQVKTLETRNSATNKSYGDIEGSPYDKKDFTESVVYSKDGSFADTPLRYDAFQDEMEFMKDGKIKWINKNEVNYIKYGKDTVLIFFNDGDTTRQGYFFLACRGKYLMFIRKTVTYRPYVPPKGYADAIPDRFIHENDEVFISQGNNPVKKIKNRKDFTEFFGHDKTALGIIKKDRIRADNPGDVKRLVSFLNGQ